MKEEQTYQPNFTESFSSVLDLPPNIPAKNPDDPPLYPFEPDPYDPPLYPLDPDPLTHFVPLQFGDPTPLL